MSTFTNLVKTMLHFDAGVGLGTSSGKIAAQINSIPNETPLAVWFYGKLANIS